MPLVLDDADPLGTSDLATHLLPLGDAPHGYEIFQEKKDDCIKRQQRRDASVAALATCRGASGRRPARPGPPASGVGLLLHLFHRVLRRRLHV